MIRYRATRSIAGGGGGRMRAAALLPKNKCLREASRWRASTNTSQAQKFAASTTINHLGITHELRGGHSSANSGWSGITAAATLCLTATALSAVPFTSCDAPPFSIKQNYDVIKLLGEGAYGRVFLAKRKSDGTPVALKAIDRNAITDGEFETEVNALRVLSRNGGHPHVCRLYDLHDDEKNFYYLALELISGGELFEHLIRNGAYSEAQAAVFLRQFAEAISFMHTNGVIHADLKPENLMLSSEKDGVALLKIVDFGTAVMCDSDSNSKSQQQTSSAEIVGTTAYWSPEMFDKNAQPTEASDMWAIGCVLYILVTGSHPFDKSGLATDDEVTRHIREARDGTYNAFDERVEGLSESCIGLMKSLLQSNPRERMTSEEFRRHPWTQGLTASWNTLNDSDQKLEAYWQNRFRAEVLRKYAKAKSTTDDYSLSDENLHNIFNTMDLDGNGTLDPREIQVALLGLGVKEKDVAYIVRSIDLDGNGTVDLDEFRTIMRKQFDNGPGVKVVHRQQRFRTKILQKFNASSAGAQSEDRLKKIFHAIDLDNNGVLDPHEIRVVLRSVGVDEHDISEIVACIDLDRSGGVDWEEFKTIMTKQFAL